MFSTGLDNIDGGKWILALEWLAVVGVFVLLARGPANEGADKDTEYEKEIVGKTIRGPVAKTELEPGQLSWLANAIEGGDAAGAEFAHAATILFRRRRGEAPPRPPRPRRDRNDGLRFNGRLVLRDHRRRSADDAR